MIQGKEPVRPVGQRRLENGGSGSNNKASNVGHVGH